MYLISFSFRQSIIIIPLINLLIIVNIIMSELREPKIAFIAIINKKNSPILFRNYMTDALSQEYSPFELQNLDMQLKMLVYQTFDLFDEKQRLKSQSVIRQPPGQSAHSETTYLGLIMETFISQFQIDVYGYISNTNYKYLIIKNEMKTNPMGQKPSDEHMKNVP